MTPGGAPRVQAGRFRPLIVRVLVLVAVVAAFIALARSDTLHEAVLALFEAARHSIEGYPILGPLLFVALAALSAMAGFVSSAVLVPAAVYAWGAALTTLLLWIGWMLGGVVAYTIAHTIGRPAVRWLVPAAVMGRYHRLFEPPPRFGIVLLFQLALPSEIPGYLLGLAGYPLSRYLAALAIAELPWAVGTVLLGVSFVERDTKMLVLLVIVAVVAAAFFARALRTRRLN